MSADPDVITDLDVVDPITVWVDCEQGESGCTGGDSAGEMVRVTGGWICPSCNWVSQKNWADEHEGRLR